MKRATRIVFDSLVSNAAVASDLQDQLSRCGGDETAKALVVEKVWRGNTRCTLRGQVENQVVERLGRDASFVTIAHLLDEQFHGHKSEGSWEIN